MTESRKIAKVVRKFKLGQEEPDATYWREQSYQARLAALEEIRREYHGWHYESEPRLQRICRVIKSA